MSYPALRTRRVETKRGTEIIWAAAFNEQKQHAHVFPVSGTVHFRQVCKPNHYTASPQYWINQKKQPRIKCKDCLAVLKILGAKAIAMIDASYYP